MDALLAFLQQAVLPSGHQGPANWVLFLVAVLALLAARRIGRG
jgi:hypothetical protein